MPPAKGPSGSRKMGLKRLFFSLHSQSSTRFLTIAALGIPQAISHESILRKLSHQESSDIGIDKEEWK